MQTTLEMPSDTAVSRPRNLRLRQVMLLLTSLVVGVVLLFAGISFHLLQRHLEDLRAAEGYGHLSIASEVLVQRLAFYDDLLRAYADNTRIRDLVSFADQEGAVAWSNEVRHALPQAIGAALFTEEGNVLGDPVAQRVGKSCIADLRDQIEGSRRHRTPLHTAVPSLAHFDLSAPVHDETGRTIGLVFVSFSIDELSKAIEGLATPSTAVALLDRETEGVVVASSNWEGLAHFAEYAIRVTGSDWVLRMRIRSDSLAPALPTLGATIAIGAGVVILLMLVFHRVLTRNYFDTVEELRDIIHRIEAGGTVDVHDLTGQNSLFPVSRELGEDLMRLGSHHEHLHVESRTDALTGLANRRVFDDGLAYLLESSGSTGAGFCVVLLDLDGFKQINDRYGHRSGDLVLKALARTLKARARGSDLVCRWGGDEFAVLLPMMPTSQVDTWVTQLRAAFDKAQQETAGLPEGVRCGVSRGFSQVAVEDPRNPQAVLDDVDRSLYRDKQQRTNSAHGQGLPT